MSLRMITIISQRMFQRGLFSINQAVRGRRVRCADQHQTVRTADPTKCRPGVRSSLTPPAENPWKRWSETPTSRPAASRKKPELEP